MKKYLAFVLVVVLAVPAMVSAAARVSAPIAAPIEGEVAGTPAEAAHIAAPRAAPIIIDHHHVDITAVPQAWIEAAKTTLHIAYGHTSHGSQVTDGMSGLVGFANGGGLGLALPQDIFAWNETGADGA
ncbi:MAG: hypothetical protein JW850_00910, partial [Thermoflexales bacterium]|nr:hypothetical protein [Thermoflexales bacterium]